MIMIHKLGRLGSGQPRRPTEWVEGGGGAHLQTPPDLGGGPHVTGGGGGVIINHSVRPSYLDGFYL